MSIGLLNSVLNQKNAPAIYEDIFANRPSAGFSGRIFISTDTSQIFVDNGSSWVLIANTGIGSTGNLQVVTTNGNTTNAGISITAGGLATNAAQITGLSQAGGVLFTDGSGNLAQDTNFNWDNTNNYLGIGQTGTPTAPLDIHNGTVGVQIQLNATSTNNSTIAFQNANIGKWRVGNLYSSGSNLFHIYNNTAANNALTINASNAATFADSLTANSLIKSGGTSSQFLKADGSVDSSSYITLTSLSATSPVQYNSSTGAFSILQSGASQSGYLSSTDWNTFNSKASLSAFSATTPLSYNSGTGAFSIQVANTGQSGYLTNTDWNTFNSKQAALSFGNLTETSSSVLTIAGGTGAVIGSGTTIAVKQANSTQSGYLSSTDWNTFNNKQPQINGTGFVKASGTTISYDNSTYYLASNPSGYITLASLSGTTPITYNSGTGAISIAQSGTSTSGYLSSTDWNTFNGKASLSAFSASPPLSYNSGTGAFSITQSSGSTNGYLSSTDWTTFNNKQSALTNPITGTGTSGYLPKFNGTTSLTNSIIQDNGSTVTISGLATSYGFTALGGTTGGFIGFNVQNSLSGAAQIGMSNSSQNWIINTRTDNNFGIYNATSNNTPLLINTSGAATFASTANIGASTASGTVLYISNTTNTRQIQAGYSAGGGYNFFQCYDGSNFQQLTINNTITALGNGGVNIGSQTGNSGSQFCVTTDGSHAQQIEAISTGGNKSVYIKAVNSGTSIISSNYISGGPYLPLGISARETASDLIALADGTIAIHASSSNSQGTFQNTGQTFTGGLGIGGLTFSTNTTATVNTSFYFFNGGAGVTLTLPDTNGQSMIYYIKNYSASPLTIGRTGSNTFIAAGTITTVTSLTLATGVSTTIIGNGTTNYIQIQ
jgi:hypothetical protein